MRKLQLDTNVEPPLFSHPLQAIVFDCDGVLFDSKEANVRFYTHILDHIGCPPVRPDQYEFIHMHPVKESLRYLLADGDHYEQAMAFCQDMDFHAFHRYLRREPGIVEVLQLAKSSYRVALATNRTISTHAVLAQFQLDQYFDMVVSALDVQFPKPHPESMERIMEAFGVTPREVLFIGDSAVDEGLALATGVYFAAYKNPSLKAHLHLNHFEELYAVLDSEKANGGAKTS
jgi:HAD superfamily hydrolase (TIGR01509 family)